MKSLLFGASVNVHGLDPNPYGAVKKIRANADRLREEYTGIDNNNLRIDITGTALLWHGEPSERPLKTFRPSVTTTIRARRTSQAVVLQNQVSRRVSAIFSEPLWLYFWRVRRKTDQVIQAAGLNRASTS